MACGLHLTYRVALFSGSGLKSAFGFAPTGEPEDVLDPLLRPSEGEVQPGGDSSAAPALREPSAGDRGGLSGRAEGSTLFQEGSQ